MQIVWDVDIWWILSQIFVTIGYVFFMAMYVPKNRNKVLILGILGALFFGVSFVFVGEWMALYTSGLGIFRNTAFLSWSIFMKGKNKRICLILLFYVPFW